VEECIPDENEGQHPAVEVDPILLDVVSRVDPSVEYAVKNRLMDLLTDFGGVFSHGENDMGRTDVVTHTLDTGDCTPVRQALQRHAPAHLDAIRQHVRGMLEQGVFEPARSPWTSNVVIVKMIDGSLRCCVDYRHFNNLTRKDAYSLPRTDMCLDAMHGAVWFRTFDLRSSYLRWASMCATGTKQLLSAGRDNSASRQCRSVCATLGLPSSASWMW